MNTNIKSVLNILVSSLFILLFMGFFILFGIWVSLSFSSGVASAYTVTLPDDGLVGSNLLLDATVEGYSGSSWTRNSEYTFSYDDGVCNVVAVSPSYYYFLSQSIFTTSSSLTCSVYCALSTGSIAFRLFDGSNYIYSTYFSSSSWQVFTYTFNDLAPGNYTFSLCSSKSTGFNVDFSYLKVEVGVQFTGFILGNPSSYEDGFNTGLEQGYNDGFNAGKDEGLVDASNLFLATAFDVSYSDSTNSIYIQNSPDAHFVNSNLSAFNLYWPYSCMRYDFENGNIVPSDCLTPSGGEVPDVRNSKFTLKFDGYYDMAQWLKDNPTDYLCNYILTGEGVPSVYVFNDLSNLDGYLNGALSAYDNGYESGYDIGYTDGSKKGYNSGYNAGHNDGVSDANTYSFLGLIGAVFDAPISAFRGLLNFDVLGVNMSAFVTAMLSLCVVFVLLKLILR